MSFFKEFEVNNDEVAEGLMCGGITLPDLPNALEILEKVKNFSYRYVRRILIFDEKESEVELKNYCGKWCRTEK